MSYLNCHAELILNCHAELVSASLLRPAENQQQCLIQQRKPSRFSPSPDAHAAPLSPQGRGKKVSGVRGKGEEKRSAASAGIQGRGEKTARHPHLQRKPSQFSPSPDAYASPSPLKGEGISCHAELILNCHAELVSASLLQPTENQQQRLIQQRKPTPNCPFSPHTKLSC